MTPSLSGLPEISLSEPFGVPGSALWFSGPLPKMLRESQIMGPGDWCIVPVRGAGDASPPAVEGYSWSFFWFHTTDYHPTTWPSSLPSLL